MNTQDPEKLSKHDLVKFLIANPEIRGNFRYHTLLSCMWRDLLIAQPGFQDVADFQKIHHRDAFKILLEQPQLADHFDWPALWKDWQEECARILIKHPQLVNEKHTSFFEGYAWSKLLVKQPQFSHLCPLKKFYDCNWVELISAHTSFAEQCPWHTFLDFGWEAMLKKQSYCLKYFKLEYLKSIESFRDILKKCYFGNDSTMVKGIFESGVQDAAAFLIIKRMDRENGKRFLKNQFLENNWGFVEDLWQISPGDVMDVHGKKYMPFYMTLMAPDSVFGKLFPVFDLTSRDTGGNSFLLPALIYSLCKEDMSRYEFLLAHGLDPDEKNLAGFSCNDLLAHVEAAKAAREAARIERNAKARERRKQKKLLAMKGKKNVR